MLFPDVLFRAVFQLPREINGPLPSILLFGTGTATAFLYLSYTFVLLRVRSRAQQKPAPSTMTPRYGQHAFPADPTYPPSPAQYFPGTGVGPGVHAPAVPPYPPSPGTRPTDS